MRPRVVCMVGINVSANWTRSTGVQVIVVLNSIGCRCSASIYLFSFSWKYKNVFKECWGFTSIQVMLGVNVLVNCCGDIFWSDIDTCE